MKCKLWYFYVIIVVFYINRAYITINKKKGVKIYESENYHSHGSWE